MSEQAPPELTLSFVQNRPAAAAQVLTELEPAVIARFLDHTPARIAAPAFALMHTDDAAAALGAMDGARAAALIRALDYADAITVVRLLSDAARQALLNELPTRFAEEVTKSLRYPRDTVGAWMDPSLPAFSRDSTVSDVLRFLRRHPRAVIDHVFVLDDARHLAGSVALGRLLGAEPAALVSALMTSQLQPLSNRARLPLVAEDPRWDSYVLLPVAGRKGNILGAMSRAQLRQGLAALEHVRSEAPVMESVTSRLIGALLVSAAELIRAASAGLGRNV